MRLQTRRQLVAAGRSIATVGPANRGVSETIGVLIMVSLVVIIATVLGLFVLGVEP